MAEARSKLVSSQSNRHELDQGAAAGKKRPLPSSTSGGGGILRKPKYSSATAAPSTNESAPKLEDADDGRSNNALALGSLMAGYDDSSSDDEGDTKAQPGDSVANQQPSAPVPSALHGKKSGEGYIANKKQKNPKERIKIDDSMNVPQRGNKIDVKIHESSKGPKNTYAETVLKGGEEGKAAEISNEVWDEFNSLLDDDEAKTANDAANEQLKPEANAGTLGAEARPTNAAKKKSKKKKKKVTVKDMYDNEGINNVEQASYEARLARLMLLKSKKMQQKNDETDNVLPSTDEFYDPGLAFQQEGEDIPGGEKATENDAESKPDKSSSGAPSNNAPHVSLAKILRDRRDQARHLSSRGNDAIENESDPANNDASDGRWF